MSSSIDWNCLQDNVINWMHFLQVFSGNNDANSIAKNKFPKPVTARFIGLNPLKWRESICLRVELYGCSVQDNINAIVS